MYPLHSAQRTAFALFCAVILSLALPAYGQPLQLVENGKGLPVVVRPDASQVEQFAAAELSRYLQKITGQSFETQTGAAQPAEGFFLGRRAAEALGISLAGEQLGDDGFIMKQTGRRIVLAGGGYRGTLYAVYAFLEEMGCRWLAPNFDFYGAAGTEFVPRLANFEIATLDVVERPSFKWRKKYVEEGQSHTTENLKRLIDWMAKARFNVFDCPLDYQHRGHTRWDNWREALIPELKKRGMLIEVGGHGYPNYLPQDQYFDRHPEWFGMLNGQRSRAANLVFSTANKEAVATFIANIETYLRAHPEIDIFDLWPPDGARWSEAPEDVALGSPSERQVLLLNQVVKALAGEFPKLRVQFLAYSSYIDPPKVNKPAPGVVMEFCPINRSFETALYAGADPQNTTYFWDLEGWANGVIDPQAITIYSYITKYAWRSLPILVPHLIADEARRFHAMGIGGQAAYSEPGGWASFELDHYIMARASWNAGLDVDRAIDDYARARYGKAGPAMAKYLRLVEEVVPHAVAIPGTTLEATRQRSMIQRFRRAEQFLNQARTAAAGDTSALLLIGKMAASEQYAMNEMRLRLAILQGSEGSREDHAIQDLLAEKRQIIQQNAHTGVITQDQRVQ